MINKTNVEGSPYIGWLWVKLVFHLDDIWVLESFHDFQFPVFEVLVLANHFNRDGFVVTLVHCLFPPKTISKCPVFAYSKNDSVVPKGQNRNDQVVLLFGTEMTRNWKEEYFFGAWGVFPFFLDVIDNIRKVVLESINFDSFSRSRHALKRFLGGNNQLEPLWWNQVSRNQWEFFRNDWEDAVEATGQRSSLFGFGISLSETDQLSIDGAFHWVFFNRFGLEKCRNQRNLLRNSKTKLHSSPLSMTNRLHWCKRLLWIIFARGAMSKYPGNSSSWSTSLWSSRVNGKNIPSSLWSALFLIWPGNQQPLWVEMRRSCLPCCLQQVRRLKWGLCQVPRVLSIQNPKVSSSPLLWCFSNIPSFLEYFVQLEKTG